MNAKTHLMLNFVKFYTACITGDPSVMLRLYLSVATIGSCTTEENGTFLVREFDSCNDMQKCQTMVKGNPFLHLLYTLILQGITC